MLTTQEVTTMLRESFTSLVKAGVIPTQGKTSLADDEVVFGIGSPLDSLAFVSLVMSLEERISEAAGDPDLVIDITEIDSFSVDEPNLTLRKLAEFLSSLTKRPIDA